jgi:hypothetical protein
MSHPPETQGPIDDCRMPERPNHTPFCAWLLGGLLIAQGWQSGDAAQAAGIRGTVHVRNTGLFSPDNTTLASGISVAALPLEGQAIAERRYSTHRIVLKDKHF